MSIHFVRDLAELQQDVLRLCEAAADVIHQGVAALETPDPEFAKRLIERDDEIDAADVRIEESCLKILALHQPVAGDLRRVATVLKITSELERVADLGVNIAERAASLVSLPPFPIPRRLTEMAALAVSMLDRSLSAYVKLDSFAAREVCGMDEAVDELNREIIDELTAIMFAQPSLVTPAMHLFSACRNVERVGDHATNIAEDVIYLVEGRIVRHQSALRVARETA